MKTTRNFLIALTLSAAAVLSGIGSASAARMNDGVQPPSSVTRRARPNVVCVTNDRVDLKRAPKEDAPVVGGLGKGTRVLPRARQNGFVFVLARSGRGWAPSGSITCEVNQRASTSS